jgi:hypothetical protein
MKKTFITFAVFTLALAAQASNYPAEELVVGAEIVVLKNIDIPKQSTGVWIQDGKALLEEHTSGLNSLRAHCWLTVDQSQYNPETGLTNSISKGIYNVESTLDADASRGATGWIIKSNNGNEFHLQCSKSASLITRAADSIGLAHKISTDNMFKISIKNVKKTLKGLIEIKD